jgi:hypothetical protein
MLIENTEARVIHIQCGYLTNSEGTGSASYTNLIPGINDVEDAVWSACKGYAGTREHLGSGALVERGLSPVKNVGLTAHDPSKALAIIKDTFKVDLLREWLEVEKRHQVIDAIKAQIELMGKVPETPKVEPTPEPTPEPEKDHKSAKKGHGKRR